jgi:hypothetical protein
VRLKMSSESRRSRMSLSHPGPPEQFFRQIHMRFIVQAVECPAGEFPPHRFCRDKGGLLTAETSSGAGNFPAFPTFNTP